MMKAITVKDGTTTADALVLGEAEKPEPENRELLIKVHYTAINRADTLQRKGKYPVPAGESLVLGLECSGEVRMHTHSHVHTLICTRLYAHTYSTHMHTRTTHTYAHTYAHTHTHVHTHKNTAVHMRRAD